MQEEISNFFLGQVEVLLEDLKFFFVEKIELVMDNVGGISEQLACSFLLYKIATESYPYSLVLLINSKISLLFIVMSRW